MPIFHFINTIKVTCVLKTNFYNNLNMENKEQNIYTRYIPETVWKFRKST